MAIHYMDGGPFETATPTGTCALVLGYEPETKKFAAILMEDGRGTGCRFWHRSMFTPPPPIPAAARKPQVGEVWSSQTGKQSFFIVAAEGANDQFLIVAADGEVCWRSRCNLIRRATPEEAEPFRPILEGLKRSLGEA